MIRVFSPRAYDDYARIWRNNMIYKDYRKNFMIILANNQALLDEFLEPYVDDQTIVELNIDDYINCVEYTARGVGEASESDVNFWLVKGSFLENAYNDYDSHNGQVRAFWIEPNLSANFFMNYVVQFHATKYEKGNEIYYHIRDNAAIRWFTNNKYEENGFGVSYLDKSRFLNWYNTVDDYMSVFDSNILTAANFLEAEYDNGDLNYRGDPNDPIICSMTSFNHNISQYARSVYLSEYNCDGDVTVMPTECVLSCELNGAWELSMSLVYDEDGVYSFIQEGCVVCIDGKVAREQTSSSQFFRIFEVEYTLQEIHVTAYPVAMESAFDGIIVYLDLENITAATYAQYLSNVERHKYKVITNIPDQSSGIRCLQAKGTNIQELICGDLDASFMNLFGAEIVYDNYIYHALMTVGNTNEASTYDKTIRIGKDLTGITVTQNTFDVITRIYPVSSEGYTLETVAHQLKPLASDTSERGMMRVDADNINDYPFPHAKSIIYDEVKLIDIKDSTDPNKSSNLSQDACRTAQVTIPKKIKTQVRRYLKRARAGNWDYSDRIVMDPSRTYTPPQEPDHPINIKTARTQLPYGYLFYSAKDAMGILKKKIFDGYSSYKELAFPAEEREFFEELIDNGFNWLKTTQIAKWMFHEDSTGTYYGRKDYSDIVASSWWYVDSYWRWFDHNGYTNVELVDWDKYKWVEYVPGEGETASINVTIITDNSENPSVVKEMAKMRFQNEDGTAYLTNMWIEDGKSKHYYVDSNGFRLTEDRTEWVWAKSNGTVIYKSTDGLRRPTAGTFMYVTDKKAWCKFDASGYNPVPFLSKDSWNWHKTVETTESVNTTPSPDPITEHYTDEPVITVDGDTTTTVVTEYVPVEGENGNIVVTTTVEVTHWFYGNETEPMIKGQWLKISGKWYFFDENGYVDTSTDDYEQYTSNFQQTNEPGIDYNREGLNSSGLGQDTEVEAEEGEETTNDNKAPTENRDGVTAWITNAMVTNCRQAITDTSDNEPGQHERIWAAMQAQLTLYAMQDLQYYKEASYGVSVDIESLAKVDGYEKFQFLEDVKLGDLVRVVIPDYNLDIYERVMAIQYDAITQANKAVTLGYVGSNSSFINQLAKLHPTGQISPYNLPEYLEDGFGTNLLTGYSNRNFEIAQDTTSSNE